jgi:hypothetical protein
MEENEFGPTGPQFYVISENTYIDLRYTESAMLQMAHEVFNDSHRESDNQRLVLSRAELNYLFAGIGELIGRALDGVGRENGILPWNGVRQ